MCRWTVNNLFNKDRRCEPTKGIHTAECWTDKYTGLPVYGPRTRSRWKLCIRRNVRIVK